MKKRGAAALLAAICLLAGCAASDPALPAETPTPTETSSPAYQGDSLFAYCTERQRELLELPHEELPVELIFHHWTETAADYETRDETVIAGSCRHCGMCRRNPSHPSSLQIPGGLHL